MLALVQIWKNTNKKPSCLGALLANFYYKIMTDGSYFFVHLKSTQKQQQLALIKNLKNMQISTQD